MMQMLKHGLKAFIIFLGILSLIGLGICSGVLLENSVAKIKRKNANNARFAALEKGMAQKTATPYEQWLYARLLQTKWAEARVATHLTGDERTHTARHIMQQAIDADVTEALLDEGTRRLLADKQNAQGKGLEGIQLIAQAHQKGCQSRYSSYFYHYNWYDMKYTAIANEVKDTLAHARKSDSAAIRREYALLAIYQHLQCTEVEDAETAVINRLVAGQQSLFYSALDYVIATRLNKPTLATLIKQRIDAKNQARFSEKVDWLNTQYDTRFANYPTRAMMQRAERQAKATRFNNVVIQ